MAIYNVATQKQLETAIAGLKNGDTILLAGGQYDLIKMRTTTRQDHSFEQKVTIASADPNNPAVVSELIMASVDNVTFSGVKFDYNPAKPSSKPFFVEKSSRVVFDNVTFEGEIVNGFGVGQGLRAKDSSQVTVVDSHFVNLQNALSFSNMSDVALLDNDVRGMSNDGFTFGGMTRILIAGNDFRDYKSPQPLAPHKDNIQFRTASGETASTDVVIRENVMVVDEARHGIFIGNEAYRDGDDASVHTNVVIEHNTLSTAQTHGITVFQADRLDIRDNILTKNPGMPLTDKLYTPIINVSKYSTHVQIQGNQVASVQTPQNETWTVAGNLVSGQRYLHWDGTLEMVNAGSRGLIIPPDPVDPEGGDLPLRRQGRAGADPLLRGRARLRPGGRDLPARLRSGRVPGGDRRQFAGNLGAWRGGAHRFRAGSAGARGYLAPGHGADEPRRHADADHHRKRRPAPDRDARHGGGLGRGGSSRPLLRGSRLAAAAHRAIWRGAAVPGGEVPCCAPSCSR